jgi:glycosyltransferase involved in cell wall biosynthesis
LIAVSEATRADLHRYYRVSEAKVRVVSEGVDDCFFEVGRNRREEELQPYVLAVSTLHPHKNLDRLIRVFAEFRRSHPQFRLVIAGFRGFHAEAIEKLIGELALRDAVGLTGWLPREKLYELYRRAWAFVYPSRFEGFGLPVVEALAAGVPTACSDIEPLRGNAGDAALLFEPLDDAAVLDALVRVCSDAALRARLAAAGPRRAGTFSWRRAAEETLAVLRGACS